MNIDDLVEITHGPYTGTVGKICGKYQQESLLVIICIVFDVSITVNTHQVKLLNEKENPEWFL